MAGGGRQRQVLAATLLGMVLTSFPSVILVAALPAIADDFGVGESSVGWVLTAPMIAGSVLLPTFGRLGDLRGHRRLFLVGFTGSTLLALATALAWDLGPLIALRTVGHAAGMATQPTALALLLATHGSSERPRALGAWAFAGAAAPVAGLLAGGPLIGVTGWRGLFAMQAAVGILALPFVLRALPETPKVPDVRFDVLGGAVLVAGSGAAVFALDRSAVWGATSPAVLVAACTAPLALWAFVRIERRTDDPLLPLALARRRAYVAPLVGEAVQQLPSIGAYFIAPLILHATFDRSVAETAYLMIPMPLAMSLFAPVGGRLTVRIGASRTAVLGSALLIVAMAVGVVAVVVESLPLLVLGFAVHGSGMGMTRPAFATAAAAALDEATTGVGMAVMRMLSQLGSAAAISIAVASRGAGGFIAVYVVLGVLAVVATAIGFAVVDEPARPEEHLSAEAALPALEG